MQYLICPQCHAQNYPNVKWCAHCHAPLAGSAPGGPPAPPHPYAPPHAQAPVTGDSTQGIIPYKNPKALLAYYLGLFSILPLVGLPMGIAAVVLGFQGLRARKEHPQIKGSVHAGIGIGCGGLMTLIWGLALVGFIIGGV